MRYLLLSIFTFIIINASAQNDDYSRHYFGFGFGLNGCIPMENSTNPGIGYSFAFDYSYSFSEKLFLHSGITVSNYAYSIDPVLTPVNFFYYDIPIELSYRLNKFSLNAGISKSLATIEGVGVNLSTGYALNKTKTHKKIDLILPAFKYFTNLKEPNNSTYFIVESKIIFSF